MKKSTIDKILSSLFKIASSDLIINITRSIGRKNLENVAHDQFAE